MDTYTGYRLLLLALIVGANAFFAASEVALISVRPSRLKELAKEGGVGPQAAMSLLANPGRLLSVVQVGVTLASLALGWAGQEKVYGLLVGLFQPVIPPSAEGALRVVSFVTGFLLITFLHVVIGEVVPKNLAIEKADQLALLVAPPLLVFYKAVGPFVWIIERSAAVLSRWIGLRGEPRGGGHSAEELKMIVSSARGAGDLPRFGEDVIHRVLDLEDVSVREIMVPRNGIVSISVDSAPEEIARTFREHQYSRVPVWEGGPEHIIGILHSKDLPRFLEAPGTALKSSLRSLLRKLPVVPETKPVSQMVDEFRRSRVHMALVVDEFGTIVGIVTFEDVLEQIFGEIEDEQDLARQPAPAEAAVLAVDGTTTILDLETQYGIVLPGGADFETLAGFLLSRLGHIPQPGERVEEEGRRYTALEMDRNRIARVLVEKMPPR
ncbi:MAG TPA: hemolysin family protein [Bryobacteraceae bacterium]|nr:hemolysin family protein [Bryobacteraceae bacterium]